jgi:mannose-6-phosphate isomerase
MDRIKPFKMKNTIQEYAWGAVDAIPRLIGMDNSDKKPMAELWMGAHSRGPSLLVDGDSEFSLREYVLNNKEAALGKETAEKYGDLPFLFKVLAAGSPLSIQVHPDKKQAEEGFARENKEQIPLDAFNRNYKDDNHKPEIICALTDFWAMRGFRKEEEILTRFEDLDLPVFRNEVKALRDNIGSPRAIESFFNAVMSLDGERKDLFIRELRDAVSQKKGDEYNWVLRLMEKYPEDAAVASPLYLNLVKLDPGQAMYLDAGELHAYLDGLGMELMASSDNVLRGGLTPKYIDREELKRVVNFIGMEPEILTARSNKEGVEVYKTPSREFELSRIVLSGEKKIYKPGSDKKVQILIITEGSVKILVNGEKSFTALKGESLFVPAAADTWAIEGDAVLYRASIPGEGEV